MLINYWQAGQKVGCFPLLVVPVDVFIKQFASIFSAYPPVNSHLYLQVREKSFQGIVGIWQPCFRPVLECPQKWHVPLDAEEGTAQPGAHVWRCFPLDALVVYPFVQDILILPVPLIECLDETVLVHPGYAVGKVQKFS